MSTAAATLLRGLGTLLRAIAAPLLALGWAAAWVATPILWCARRCQDLARAWDPRFRQDGQHADLDLPSGAPCANREET